MDDGKDKDKGLQKFIDILKDLPMELLTRIGSGFLSREFHLKELVMMTCADDTLDSMILQIFKTGQLEYNRFDIHEGFTMSHIDGWIMYPNFAYEQLLKFMKRYDLHFDNVSVHLDAFYSLKSKGLEVPELLTEYSSGVILFIVDLPLTPAKNIPFLSKVIELHIRLTDEHIDQEKFDFDYLEKATHITSFILECTPENLFVPFREIAYQLSQEQETLKYFKLILHVPDAPDFELGQETIIWVQKCASIDLQTDFALHSDNADLDMNRAGFFGQFYEGLWKVVKDDSVYLDLLQGAGNNPLTSFPKLKSLNLMVNEYSQSCSSDTIEELNIGVTEHMTGTIWFLGMNKLRKLKLHDCHLETITMPPWIQHLELNYVTLEQQTIAPRWLKTLKIRCGNEMPRLLCLHMDHLQKCSIEVGDISIPSLNTFFGQLPECITKLEFSALSNLQWDSFDLQFFPQVEELSISRSENISSPFEVHKLCGPNVKKLRLDVGRNFTETAIIPHQVENFEFIFNESRDYCQLLNRLCFWENLQSLTIKSRRMIFDLRGLKIDKLFHLKLIHISSPQVFLSLMTRSTSNDNTIKIIFSIVPDSLKQFEFSIEKPEERSGDQRNGRKGPDKESMHVTYMFPMVYLPKFMKFDAYETMKSFVSTT
ncbi:unnamed protein product [Ambrosiozyma monospora]|uniref:Unnamed protein product n=1 Tax=Ambrosiozyma monospora TaxID=43982 RepID=A0ACB5STH7_AMBMO|nr:unnamed protein product [Ambrosiozyma monospora]